MVCAYNTVVAGLLSSGAIIDDGGGFEEKWADLMENPSFTSTEVIEELELDESIIAEAVRRANNDGDIAMGEALLSMLSSLKLAATAL